MTLSGKNLVYVIHILVDPLTRFPISAARSLVALDSETVVSEVWFTDNGTTLSGRREANVGYL
jgi:hypothetical protein